MQCKTLFFVILLPTNNNSHQGKKLNIKLNQSLLTSPTLGTLLRKFYKTKVYDEIETPAASFKQSDFRLV